MNAFRIDGQKAVVTGGGSGLGLGIAKVFIEAGAEVIIVGRNEEKLRQAQQQLGEKCSYRAFDVTKIDEIPALVQEIGAVDILVRYAPEEMGIGCQRQRVSGCAERPRDECICPEPRVCQIDGGAWQGTYHPDQFHVSHHGYGADCGLYHRQDRYLRIAT